MDPIRDPFILEREKGLFARNIPCLRKVAVKPFGLALASLVSSAKFVSSHFVHEPNYANPLLGFSTILTNKNKNDTIEVSSLF